MRIWLGAIAVWLWLAAPVAAATIEVETLGDAQAADGNCVLREALANANADNTSGSVDCAAGAGADTIRFAVDGTLTLTALLPNVTSAVTIEGGREVTISGGDAFPVFLLPEPPDGEQGANLTLRELTVRDAYSEGFRGPVAEVDYDTALRVEDSLIVDNVGAPNELDFGETSGAIESVGSVTVVRSTFRDNTGERHGAIGFSPGEPLGPSSRLEVFDSTFTGNRSVDAGAGAIGAFDAEVVIRRSLFKDNSSTTRGGALGLLLGEAEVVNSTLVGNTATLAGGALYSQNDVVRFVNSTLVGNRSLNAAEGQIVSSIDVPTQFVNTILAGNGTGPNCVVQDPALLADGGGNIDSGNTCGISANNSLSNTDPRLDPAGARDNGGRSETVAPCRDAGAPAGCTQRSPAVDFGVEAFCTSTPVGYVDQRGFNRGFGPRCDSGAYEVGRDRVRFEVDAVTVDEAAGTATLEVLRLDGANEAATVDYRPLAGGTATSGADFTPVSGTLTFAPGDRRETITIPIADTTYEGGQETFRYELHNVSANSWLDLAQATITIVDDDPLPALTVSDVSAQEGDVATFTVSLDRASVQTVTVTYQTFTGSATAEDFQAASGSLSFAPGEVEKTVPVQTVEDRRDESDELFALPLVSATNAVDSGEGAGLGTIVDDDVVGAAVAPTAGLQTTEAGGTAAFTVALTSQPAADVTVAITSSDTTEGTVAPASLTFTPGNFDTPRTVTVTGVDDAEDDGDVAYTLRLEPATSTDPAFAGLDPADVAATNADDDAAPTPTPTPTVSPTVSPTATATPGGTATPEPTATATPEPTPPSGRCTIRGTSGADELRGTPGRDVICAGAGDDTVRARGGDDVVRAGAGRDRVSGAAGSDTLRGQGGADRLSAGSGTDRLFGGPGADVLRGTRPPDRLVGGPGADRVTG